MKKKLLTFITALCLALCSLGLIACGDDAPPTPPSPPTPPEPPADTATYFEAEDGELYNCSIRETVSGRSGGIVQTFRDSRNSSVTFYVGSDAAESGVPLTVRAASAITEDGEKDHDVSMYNLLTVNNESVPMSGVIEARICASYEWCDITAEVDLIQGTNIIIFHYDVPKEAGDVPEPQLEETAYEKDGLDLRLNVDYMSLDPKEAALSVGENPQDDDFVYGISVAGAAIKEIKNKNAESLTVPGSVTTAFGEMPLKSLLEGALSGCGNLKSLSVPFIGASAEDSSDETGDLGYIFGRDPFEGSIAVNQDNNATKGDHNWHIPGSLAEVTVTGAGIIKAAAFAGLTTVKKVVFAHDDISFKVRSFWNCSGLEQVVLPNADVLNTVYLFSGCSSLKNVVIPDAVTALGANGMFKECTSLEWVVIGANVTSVANNTFFQIPQLQTVYYKGTEENWNKITIAGKNSSNNVIKDASCKIYFYSETEQAGMWHYNEDGAPVLWE